MSLNNNFYKAVKRLNEVSKAVELVETIIYAKTENKDLYKNTKFPLVHINPVPSAWTNSKSNIFVFEIGVLDIRSSTKQTKDTIFEGNDNIIDNHNTTYAILNEILSVLDRSDDQIYLTSVGQIQPIYYSDKNGLDGYGTTITLELPNFLDVC